MAEIVLGVLGALGSVIEVVKFVGRPILRQCNYLCCFTTNIGGLEDEAKKLDDAFEGLQRQVQTESDNNKDPFPEVETWLTNSKKIQDEIKVILDKATNVKINGCSKLGDRFSLSKEAKTKTESTKAHRVEKPAADKFLERPNAARQEVELGRIFECESRNKIEEDIMTALRGGDVNMMGICGMGGLGKTTLAQKIRNRVLVENVFQEVAMAVVSQPVDKSKIQVEIGGSLGLYLKDDTSETRVQKLHARLSDTKRSTLLVLDDVWKTLELEEFGIPRDSKACTILLTSRNRDVLSATGCSDENIFGMKVLSEQEAWSFFGERAGSCVDDRELNPIAKQVAKECKGLPIALKIVSAVLKDEDDVSIWEDALRQLRHSDPDIPTLITEVYNPLKLSYDGLSSEQAKSMFLLFCLFREDDDIPLEYMTYFCMELDIYKGIGNLKEARNKTRAFTKMLKRRSLLLDSDREECVRMHDVVRDVCIFIAKEKGYIGKDGCTWISSSHLVGERNVLLSGSRCPNLRLLFLDSTYDDSLGFKFDNAFLEGMTKLDVLCIQNCNSLTRLPHPTQSLGKLNTLVLHSCDKLETLSVVGELVYLEILICRYCDSLKKLPLEMKGLKRLKLLDLTACRNLESIGRGIISSLVALEELKMEGSFDTWEADDGEERENAGAQLRELEALPNLACLEINISDPSLVAENMHLSPKKIERYIIRIYGNIRKSTPSKFNKSLCIYLKRETRVGHWIEDFLRDTEYLYLSGDGANNVDWAKIQNIKWLDVGECKNMKNIDATVFPSIECLELESLPELQEICDGPIPSTSFQNLKELKLEDLRALTQIWKSSSVPQNNNVPHFSNLSSIVIWNCDSLRNLGQLSMVGKDCLPQLEYLGIGNCEMMEQVFLWNDEEGITKVFPKLKNVSLNKLPNLTTFYEEIQGIEFPLLLETLEIVECPKMKSIIGSGSADIDDDGSLHFLRQTQKNLNKLVLIRLSALTQFWRSSRYVPHFDNLSSIYIKECHGLRNLGQLSMAGKDCLTRLEKLNVESCEMLEQLFLWNDIEQTGKNKAMITKVFPKLKEVELRYLPNLTTFYQGIKCIEFPLLMKMKILSCPKMKSITGSSSAEIDLRLLICQPQKVSFGSLEVLDIFGYEGRMSLFTLSMAENLVSLRELRIRNCVEMIKMIEDEQQQQRILLLFPSLQILMLKSLPN